ncbi:MAG: hypothetical protein R2736_13770 [Solirubrobacterales bacterium]|jgi:hypothetical protein
MRRSRTELDEHYIRKSVGALSDEREPCRHCGRTPLVGERVHRLADGRLVCELCRPLRRVEDAREELVQHFERGQTVRRM